MLKQREILGKANTLSLMLTKNPELSDKQIIQAAQLVSDLVVDALCKLTVVAEDAQHRINEREQVAKNYAAAARARGLVSGSTKEST